MNLSRSPRIPLEDCPIMVASPPPGAESVEVPVAAIAKGQRITGADREKLASKLKKRYESGASIRELAADTHRSYGFVHRLLSDAGVALRGRGGATRGKVKKAKT